MECRRLDAAFRWAELGTMAKRSQATALHTGWLQSVCLALLHNSLLARLNYVHNNPVHHGIVPAARQYPWCSASWFENSADRLFFAW